MKIPFDHRQQEAKLPNKQAKKLLAHNIDGFLHKIVLNPLKNVPAVKMSKNYFGTHVKVYLPLAWNAIRYFIRDPLSSTYELTL